jgi:hypothetical protein
MTRRSAVTPSQRNQARRSPNQRATTNAIVKRRRPIGNREPSALAGDEAADKEERKGRAAKDYREPMAPQHLFSKGDQGGFEI